MSEDRWEDHALCKGEDIDLFFEPWNHEDRAKTTCYSCVVQDQCLLFAVQNGIWDGIWGGMTPDERKLWARKNRLARHGTLTGYTTDGCRCENCKKEMTEYDREHRPRRRVSA